MATQAKKKAPALKLKVGKDGSVQAVAQGQSGPPFHGFDPDKLPPVPVPETITNPATKSVFHVLGTSKEGLRVSLRFFRNKALEGHTGVGFRMRIGDQNPVGAKEYMHVENVRDFVLKKHKGLLEPSSVSATPVTVNKMVTYPHCSIEGAMEFNVPNWDHTGMALALSTQPFIEELWYVLLVFTDGDFVLNRPQFESLVKRQVYLLYKDVPKPQEPEPKMRYKMGSSSNRLMTSDKSKMTKKEAVAATGLVLDKGKVAQAIQEQDEANAAFIDSLPEEGIMSVSKADLQAEVKKMGQEHAQFFKPDKIKK